MQFAGQLELATRSFAHLDIQQLRNLPLSLHAEMTCNKAFVSPKYATLQANCCELDPAKEKTMEKREQVRAKQAGTKRKLHARQV